MTNVLVEGGCRVLGSFLDSRQIDEVHVYLGPKLFGGASALGPVGGDGVARLQEALAFEPLELQRLGDDILVHGRVAKKSETPAEFS